MKTITLTSHQAKMILIILERGIDYYPGNTSEEERDLVKQVKEQLLSKMKKNQVHSLLYKEYKANVHQINALQLEIQSYKNYLNIRGNYFKSQNVINQLKQTREKLKSYQYKVKTLKEKIRYYNNLTTEKMFKYYRRLQIPNPYNYGDIDT